MTVAILIPARFQSSRYPGKPLVGLRGTDGQSKPLIQRSFEAASRVPAVGTVHVVTDDSRIAEAARSFGAPVIMTSPECRNGTERCAEALDQLDAPDIVVNLQGDALLTPPDFVTALVDHMRGDAAAQVATPAVRLSAKEFEALRAAEAKGVVGGTSVVGDRAGNALYFSKRLIPFVPKDRVADDPSPVRLHVGLYAYRPEALRDYVAAAPVELELLEGLEQLRFLSLGVPVALVDMEAPAHPLIELNNPEDMPQIERALAQAGIA